MNINMYTYIIGDDYKYIRGENNDGFIYTSCIDEAKRFDKYDIAFKWLLNKVYEFAVSGYGLNSNLIVKKFRIVITTNIEEEIFI